MGGRRTQPVVVAAIDLMHVMRRYRSSCWSPSALDTTIHSVLTNTTLASLHQQARIPSTSFASRRFLALPKPNDTPHHHHASTPKCTCRGSLPASPLPRPARTSLCRAQQWPPEQQQQQPQQPEMLQGQGWREDDAASPRSSPVVPLLLRRSHGTSSCVCWAALCRG